LNVEYQGTPSDLSLQLVIVSHNIYTSPAGIMHIVGEVENQGDTTRDVKVIATGYDENSTVVAYAFSYTNPEDLSNTQKAPFDVIILSDRAPLVENYILIVESSDYQSVMIPEFSNIYFVLLFSLLFLAYGKRFLINKMLLK
ncbi:FxLYD domain-containing protein, partial [[Eubacterium] cellulosolvens]